jgi:hypothetical protein
VDHVLKSVPIFKEEPVPTGAGHRFLNERCGGFWGSLKTVAALIAAEFESHGGAPLDGMSKDVRDEELQRVYHPMPKWLIFIFCSQVVAVKGFRFLINRLLIFV